METKIKNLEQDIINEDKLNEYKTAKDEFENFYDSVATRFKIRSKCNWYQYSKKSTKYFLNLEKQKAINGTVKIVPFLDNISLPVVNNRCFTRFFIIFHTF